MGHMLLSLVLAMIFWIWHQNKGNKDKNEQLKLHQTKKFLHSKGNQQQNEKTGMEENTFKPYIW